MLKVRSFALGVSLLGLVTGACQCDGLEGAAPFGVLQPVVFDFGPVPLGTECLATLQLSNRGTADLYVDRGGLKDTNGEFTLDAYPQFIGLQSSQDVVVRYVSGGPENERQSTTVELQTNTPENGGLLTATVTALPTNEQAAVAVTSCGEGDEAESPCPPLDFGATQKSDAAVPVGERAGRTLTVHVLNEGNAPMEVAAAIIDGGDGDFVVTGLRLGNILSEAPVTLSPGRGENCGEVVNSDCATPGNCNRLTIDVKYAPSALGGDSAELVILSDAAEGAELRVPLSGFGSDIGIITTPEYVVFPDVAEGATDEVAVRVANVGTNTAPVNNTCIDVGGDGTCDGNCTGNEPALEGALSCKVQKADGGREGKGFVLGATDAAEGGDDERDILVTWSPVAGNATIPAGTVLRLETGILNNKVYEVPVAGGAAGVLVATSPDACGEELCVPTEGDPADVGTWAGELSLTLENTGDASIEITAFEWDGPETIADDYELFDADDNPVDFASPGITLAPGASETLTISYANDDLSGADIINLLVHHTGLGGLSTLTVRPVPPS